MSFVSSYDDTLVVPIIENTPEEKDLKDRMARAMEEYPDSCAVLVRRHGVYVWGESWEKAKTMWALCVCQTINLFRSLALARNPNEASCFCHFSCLQVRVLRLPVRHRRPDEAVWTGPFGPPSGRKGNRLTFSHCSFLKRLLLQKGQEVQSAEQIVIISLILLCSRYVDWWWFG